MDSATFASAVDIVMVIDAILFTVLVSLVAFSRSL